MQLVVAALPLVLAGCLCSFWCVPRPRLRCFPCSHMVCVWLCVAVCGCVWLWLCVAVAVAVAAYGVAGT